MSCLHPEYAAETRQRCAVVAFPGLPAGPCSSIIEPLRKVTLTHRQLVQQVEYHKIMRELERIDPKGRNMMEACTGRGQAWIKVEPSLHKISCTQKQTGMAIPNEESVFAFRRRFRLKVGDKFKCVCGESMDEYGDHAASCMYCGHRKELHDELNMLHINTYNKCIGKGAEAEENCGLEGKVRPADGSYIDLHPEGKQVALDHVITNPLADSHVKTFQKKGLMATLKQYGADPKNRKYKSNPLWQKCKGKLMLCIGGISTEGIAAPGMQEWMKMCVEKTKVGTSSTTRSRKLAALKRLEKRRSVLIIKRMAQIYIKRLPIYRSWESVDEILEHVVQKGINQVKRKSKATKQQSEENDQVRKTATEHMYRSRSSQEADDEVDALAQLLENAPIVSQVVRNTNTNKMFKDKSEEQDRSNLISALDAQGEGIDGRS